MSRHVAFGLASLLVSACNSSEPDRTAATSPLAAELRRPVAELGGAGDAGDVLCDVWHVGGDFPTLIDCYFAPDDVAETSIAGAVAVRLGVDVLLPDGTLNPTRYVRAAPDGTLRAVHVDEVETDDGTERRHARPCTGADPACAVAPERDAA